MTDSMAAGITRRESNDICVLTWSKHSVPCDPRTIATDLADAARRHRRPGQSDAAATAAAEAPGGSAEEAIALVRRTHHAVGRARNCRCVITSQAQFFELVNTLLAGLDGKLATHRWRNMLWAATLDSTAPVTPIEDFVGQHGRLFLEDILTEPLINPPPSTCDEIRVSIGSRVGVVEVHVIQDGHRSAMKLSALTDPDRLALAYFVRGSCARHAGHPCAATLAAGLPTWLARSVRAALEAKDFSDCPQDWVDRYSSLAQPSAEVAVFIEQAAATWPGTLCDLIETAYAVNSTPRR